jgi:hypothetical protein
VRPPGTVPVAGPGRPGLPTGYRTTPGVFGGANGHRTSLVMDLRITDDRVGSSTDPILDGQLRSPKNLDQSLNDVDVDKIRKYRADYNNNPPSPVSFIPAIPSTSGRLHSEFVRLLFLQTHRETDHFQVLQLQEFSLRNLPVNCMQCNTPYLSKGFVRRCLPTSSFSNTKDTPLSPPDPRFLTSVEQYILGRKKE